MQQPPVEVLYVATIVGEYFADLLVSNMVIVELKAVSGIGDLFALLRGSTTLKATGLPICLVMNFGKRLEIASWIQLLVIVLDSCLFCLKEASFRRWPEPTHFE